MDNDYIEAIVFLREATTQSGLVSWFGERGMQLLQMRVGFLAMGSISSFERAFHVELGEIREKVYVPVPPELRDHVESIQIREPPRTHDS